MRAVAALAVVLVALAAGGGDVASAAGAGEPRFRGTIRAIPEQLRDRMVSWREGCPVGLDDLRLLELTHWGFDGKARRGRLIVHEDVARDVVSVFRRLFQAGYPIRRMQLVDAYGGDDYRSIEADNTSAFNCRNATGSGNWSNHAYGYAIDLNPLENPYVSGGRTSHPRSERYLDRRRRLKGMIREGDVVTRAFDAIGWGWGGRWTGSVRDYQHFSINGR
ncbi:MAG: M15 family metallopeptidase [Thermoleophilia bacterium]